MADASRPIDGSASMPGDWPPYSYVPGKFPHPNRDPQGHSYGHVEPAASPLSSESWRHNSAYLRGIELFNAGFYWEAHESWEAVWHGCGRVGTAADFCKGLIKLAAAGVKAREGRPMGVERHARRACELFRQVGEQPADNSHCYMGLSLAVLRRLAEKLAQAPADFVNTGDQPVVRIMPAKIELLFS